MKNKEIKIFIEDCPKCHTEIDMLHGNECRNCGYNVFTKKQQIEEMK